MMQTLSFNTKPVHREVLDFFDDYSAPFELEEHSDHLSDLHQFPNLLDQSLQVEDDDFFDDREGYQIMGQGFNEAEGSLAKSTFESSDNLLSDLPMTPSDIVEDTVSLKGHASDFNKSEAYPKDNSNLSEYDAALELMKLHSFLLIDGSLYYFDFPCYRRGSEDQLIALFKTLLPHDFIRSHRYSFWKGVIGQLQTTSALRVPYEELQLNETDVIFRNGIYNAQTKKLRPATPDDHLLSCNNVSFDLDVHTSGPTTDAFFQSFSGGDQEIQDLAWAILGALLSQHAKYKKFFLLFGVPDSGKSVFQSLVEHLVGPESCSHIMVDAIAGKFSTAQMVGKTVNICADANAGDLGKLGALKQITGGGSDLIECEGKYSKFQTLHTDRLKLLFASNTFPKVSPKEDSSSFYNRMCLLPFLYPVPESERDYSLIDKLRDETPYIVHRAMKAYRKLHKHNYRFPHCRVVDQIIQNERSNNPPDALRVFIQERCVLGSELSVRTDDLYDAYCKFCEEMGVPNLYNRYVFPKEIRHFGMFYGIRKNDGKDEYGHQKKSQFLYGISLHEDCLDTVDMLL